MDSTYEKPGATVADDLEDAHNTAQDDAAMAEVGKIQQVRRNFGFWSVLGLSTSMMCTW